MQKDTGVTTFVDMYLLLCFSDLIFMTFMQALDKISWYYIDLCWNVTTFGKFSETFRVFLS